MGPLEKNKILVIEKSKIIKIYFQNNFSWFLPLFFSRGYGRGYGKVSNFWKALSSSFYSKRKKPMGPLEKQNILAIEKGKN